MSEKVQERSVAGELRASSEYSTLDDGTLFDKALHFTELAQNSELSPRAVEDVERILGRLVFELSYRDQSAV